MASGFDLDGVLAKCWEGTLLSLGELLQLCAAARQVLEEDENCVKVSAPVIVVGDIHGQFYDLLELFKVCGAPPLNNFLFLGDYVDRGRHSVETICLLLALKVKYPLRMTLLRGNHETRAITKVYGFCQETGRKFGVPDAWNAIMHVFDALCIAAVIENTILCLHGGLSPSLQRLEQLWLIDRFKEPPSEGIISDVMWSDPDASAAGFVASSRGAGYTFGGDVVQSFLKENGLQHILRAHQLCMEGFQVLYDGAVCTVWSAPNYCYRCGNRASVLQIDESLGMFFNVFAAAPDQGGKDDSEGGKCMPDYFL